VRWSRTCRPKRPNGRRCCRSLPRLAHQALNQNRLVQLEAGLTLMLHQQNTRNRWLGVIAGLLAVLAAATLYFNLR